LFERNEVVSRLRVSDSSRRMKLEPTSDREGSILAAKDTLLNRSPCQSEQPSDDLANRSDRLSIPPFHREVSSCDDAAFRPLTDSLVRNRSRNRLNVGDFEGASLERDRENTTKEDLRNVEDVRGKEKFSICEFNTAISSYPIDGRTSRISNS